MRRYCAQRKGGVLVIALIVLILLAIWVGLWAARARSRSRMTQFFKNGLHESKDQLGLKSGFVAPENIPRAFIETREDDKNYEVRASFPDNNARDVEVTVGKDRKLHMSVSNQTRGWTWLNWLPAKITKQVRVTDSVHLQDDASTEINVERKGHDLVIHIPKIHQSPVPER